MMNWIDLLTVRIVFAVACISLPLIVIAYYFLRLGLRRRILLAKIRELHLEAEYLRIFHFSEWKEVRGKDPEPIRRKFENVFSRQFQGDNSFWNYLVPLALTFLTTLVFALVICAGLSPAGTEPPFVRNKIILFAIAGSLLYVYPIIVSRYASLSLTPHTLYELMGRLWLAAIVGGLVASLSTESIQPAAAFLGALIPIAAIDLLGKKVFGETDKENAARISDLLEVLHGDRDLLTQLNYIGIRSILELAYENPLRIFVETDLNLVTCFDLVDQANLCLYIPKKDTRQELNKYGIRTAVDIMTQIYEDFPDTKDPQKTVTRFLESKEDLPNHLKEPLTKISKTMGLETVDELRNMIQMMIDNPQLDYIFSLWGLLSVEVDKSTVEK